MHDFMGDIVGDVAGEIVTETGNAVHRRWGWTGCLLASLAILLVLSGGAWLLLR